mgnify:CR=1 FL=1
MPKKVEIALISESIELIPLFPNMVYRYFESRIESCFSGSNGLNIDDFFIGIGLSFVGDWLEDKIVILPPLRPRLNKKPHFTVLIKSPNLEGLIEFVDYLKFLQTIFNDLIKMVSIEMKYAFPQIENLDFDYLESYNYNISFDELDAVIA